MEDCEWTVSDEDNYNLRLVVEYKASKEMADSAKKRADKLKAELVELVDTRGYEGENGHLWYEIGEYKLKRERRVSKTFDAAGCEEWAKETGLWDDVSEVVESLSEDKVLALAWDDPDIRSEIERFYIEKETWAFKL
ncbi:MAG: hypothetical protein CL489_02895 [Acidobacteria bacterium]|jgi:hypothetical protein|nr:hypothetical protein [Acidobacteriota bacterium]